MELYHSVVYPLTLVVFGATAVMGVISAITTRFGAVLAWFGTSVWIATAVQTIAVIVGLIAGWDVSLPLILGYALAGIILLFLLGIGRLGEPSAAELKAEPDRPVLSPAQVVRVNGMAAALVGVAAAVVAWRIDEIVMSA